MVPWLTVVCFMQENFPDSERTAFVTKPPVSTRGAENAQGK